MYRTICGTGMFSWTGALTASAFAFCFTGPAPLDAQATVPVVHVIATGGTISNTGGQRRTGEELLAAIPGIERFATVTVEQFSNVASGSITLEHMKQIADRVNEVFRTRPEVQGVVVTHGTDTLEETAYFLDLSVASCKPVIITGAMRQATAVGADGPANLFNSVRAAASQNSMSRGALVLMNDEIFTARSVAKVNTVRTNAFAAPVVGVTGVVDSDGIIYNRAADRSDCAKAIFDVSQVTSFPRVEIVYVYAGADSVMVKAAVDAGAKGLVVAAAGAGASTPAQSRAISAARSQGVFVLTSSRTGGGRVTVARGNIPASPEGRGAQSGAGGLNPQKARILLLLGLATGAEPSRIVELLRIQ